MTEPVNDALFVAVAALVNVGDDGSDNQQRFQPFAQDDGQAVDKERNAALVAAEHSQRLVDIGGEGGDFLVNGGDVLARVHQADDFGEMPFQLGFEIDVARADGVLHPARLEHIKISVLHLIDRLGGIARLIGRLRLRQ